MHPVDSLTLGAITFRDRAFPDIVDAASAAGFTSIGLTVGQCVAALERGISLDELLIRMSDAGVRLGELELIRLADPSHVRLVNSLVEDLALALEPGRVHVAAWGVESSVLHDAFAAVCARLPGLPVAFEFMPYNAVPSFAAATALAEAVDAPNAGVVLDILHFFRSGGSLDELTVRSLSRVTVVQLSDVVDRGASLFDEARHRRTYPGRGTLDSVGFLRALRDAAPRPLPFSVEPIADALEQLPLALVADEAMVSTQVLLDRAFGGAAVSAS